MVRAVHTKDLIPRDALPQKYKNTRMRTNRIMQPLEAAAFATIDPNLNLNPVSIFPTRFQWCMCLPFAKKYVPNSTLIIPTPCRMCD